ncbi:hypothetical protein GAP32_460 [Cronobacter phage vB_CsaM_GAP32]|uniref:Putative membrane protein n=1 Tax=Cronobacter phage vB_CsaM_GAP32 TaxID=1141136 RepID=K4F7T0_9CAUD|nr:hypothetical protein GAP32_460 [Cronobacter phage vB_CsaM_GAP32]AFC21917.1 putative membrane protein [Cronobacter phage vB_CsaM_GAP32]
MTDVQIIIICTAIVAFCAWSIHNSTKTIAARLHCRVMGIPYEEPKQSKPLPSSPYSIIHTCSNKGTWGFCVTKHGEIYRSSTYASAPVYPKLEAAIQVMNAYEKIEGYKITTIEDVE